MGAALPVHIFGINWPQIRLVNQGRRLQGMARTLPPQVAGRLVAQLLVDDWGEPSVVSDERTWRTFGNETAIVTPRDTLKASYKGQDVGGIYGATTVLRRVADRATSAKCHSHARFFRSSVWLVIAEHRTVAAASECSTPFEPPKTFRLPIDSPRQALFIVQGLAIAKYRVS